MGYLGSEMNDYLEWVEECTNFSIANLYYDFWVKLLEH